MAKRRARTADTARLPQLAVDAWTLEVENLLGVRTPVRRNEVLRYAAALLLVRRWVALNRCGHSRASRYSRLPRDVAALGRMEFSGVFAYAVGGARAVEDTTVLNVLQCMKVNDEMFDFCTALFDSALAGAHSAQEAEWKAYVMARTSSRAAAGLQAFHASWDSLQHGLDLLLSEARREGVEPRQLFSQSFVQIAGCAMNAVAVSGTRKHTCALPLMSSSLSLPGCSQWGPLAVKLNTPRRRGCVSNFWRGRM